MRRSFGSACTLMEPPGFADPITGGYHSAVSDTRSWLSHERYPLVLFSLLLAFAALLGIAPHDRADWLLENALLVLGVGFLLATRRALPFSRISYTFIFLFLCLHTIGAHYTYSLVPYDAW